MNEARDETIAAKSSIAYAYVIRHEGVVEGPATKSEISHFHVGVTEERFKTKFEDKKAVETTGADKEQYIRQLTDTINVVDARLGDMANKHDPTKGAGL